MAKSVPTSSEVFRVNQPVQVVRGPLTGLLGLITDLRSLKNSSYPITVRFHGQVGSPCLPIMGGKFSEGSFAPEDLKKV